MRLSLAGMKALPITMPGAILLLFAATNVAAAQSHAAGCADSETGTAVECADSAHYEAAARAHRAESLYNQGRTSRAIADYSEAIGLDPKSPEWFRERGEIWLDKGDYERAIADFDRAIELDPRHAQTHYSRGRART